MLIATVPYVGKRLHLDPDPELNYGSGSEHANNFGSGSTTLETGILLLALSCHIAAAVIDHCGLVLGGLCPEPSLGLRADNVISHLIHSSSVPVSRSRQVLPASQPT
jgi:hypothetical protein